MVNQFMIRGPKSSKRPDIIILVNGLPLAVFELKNPADEKTPIVDSYNQLQTYKEEIPDLFIYNAMLVCMGRDICVRLYDEIMKLKPEWADADATNGVMKVIMTGSSSDRKELQPHIHPRQTMKDLEKRFKDAADSFQIAIVRDMWLTGFDAPSLHTIYIDKPMRGHSLMQAIARVNRVFKKKPGGLVVDYIGIGHELKLALKEYTDSGGTGDLFGEAATRALPAVKENIDRIRGMFHGFDYQDFETDAISILADAADHIIGLGQDRKKTFLDCVTAVTKAYALCSTLDEASIFGPEIAFFQAVKAYILKPLISQKKFTDQQRELALRQIMSRAVVSDEVMDIFGTVGMEKMNIGILSEAFLEEVLMMPQKNLAVELLERLLKNEVESRLKTNVVQSKKFSELLTATIGRYHNRAIETIEVIEELLKMAKAFQEAANEGNKLGLSQEEVAFYDALADNEASVRELGDEVLKKIAVELTENLRKSTTVGWAVRDSVRARLRLMVKRILRKYKYPPEEEQAAVELVLEQAETLSEHWVADRTGIRATRITVGKAAISTDWDRPRSEAHAGIGPCPHPQARARNRPRSRKARGKIGARAPGRRHRATGNRQDVRREFAQVNAYPVGMPMVRPHSSFRFPALVGKPTGRQPGCRASKTLLSL